MAEYNNSWSQIHAQPSREFRCGFCDREVAAHMGWRSHHNLGSVLACPNCLRPTYIDELESQHPGPLFGQHIDKLDAGVELAYREARQCFQASSYTAVVMLCRKLIMSIAVAKGAKENLKFVEYVNWLASNHFVPPNTTKALDFIREIGNEANHELHPRSQHEAEKAMSFLTVLLKMVFEFADE